MKKISLIFNPVSGRSNGPQDLEKIRECLLEQVDLDVHFTAPEHSATQLTQTALENGAELVIASGGDGTVSQVAAKLVNTDIPLAVIPRGTANAFAAALELPDDIEAACDVILHGQPQSIDIATCNDQPMILLAGIGLEADAIGDTSRESKQRLGFFAYLLTAVQKLQDLQTFKVTLDLGDRQEQIPEALAITVANLAPETSILAHGNDQVRGDDGLLDITILTMESGAKISEVLSASYELFQSALQAAEAEHSQIRGIRAQQVTVETDPPQKLLLDGELIGETPAHFQVIPAGLRVQMPVKEDKSQE